MLEIKPVQTKEEQNKICGACGVVFDPDCFAYSAVEDGEKLLGAAQFRIFGGCGIIYDLANADGIDDLEALILTGRTALNFIDSCGIKDAVIKTKNRDLPKILGFTQDENGLYRVNLEGYFISPCKKINNNFLGGKTRMKILDCSNKAFRRYGFEVTGYDLTGLLAALDKTHCPKDSVTYKAEEPTLQNEPVCELLRGNLFGGMPVQLGYCNGHNLKLNCLEYHRGSEFIAAGTPIVLLVADLRDVEDGKLDLGKVEAFYVPKGGAVALYETTLHYAPCTAENEDCFRSVVGLPQGTNVGKPEITPLNEEDKMLWAKNKWLIAHPDTGEAKNGAYAGLVGENITL